MDYSERLDALQQRVAVAKGVVRTAATESRDKVVKRIDQAQAGLGGAATTAKKQAQSAKASAQGRWAQVKADATAKREDVKVKITKRNRQMDAKAAAHDADWAEDDAGDAIQLAEWALDNAELAILEAIDARAYADEAANAVPS